MTETDTSRVERPCPNCGVTLNGWSGLRHCGHYTTHAHADCIKNLRRRAEKAEAERDTAWNDAIEAAAEKALVSWCAEEAEGHIISDSILTLLNDRLDGTWRDQVEQDAWNDAIEAAAGAVREKWATQTNAELEAAIRNLKKGEPT